MSNTQYSLTASATAKLLVWVCRLVTGIRARWLAPLPQNQARIYYANHSSHLDGLVIWASLPEALRVTVHPVAAADYWQKGRIRNYLAKSVFKAVLVSRQAAGDRSRNNALQLMTEPLEQGHSLILFPEGTRGAGERVSDFKSGIWHLARKCPQAELVPVYLENLNRVLPKGSCLVVPILCSAIVGEPVAGPQQGETKTDFLIRLKGALEALANDR
ncbi:lysophospholipid acyltransferase family protein [Oleidesulfovibrio sp.]|uniref:lysophospholipid acyltransferase family protein n=1 Tax=Oleidesulfovibrio sp. TaxID=2909707 RepID=UPI003A85FA76